MPARRSSALLGSALLVALAAAPADAQRITSRADLAALLAGGGTTEDFELFPVDPATSFSFSATNFDVTTEVPGEGTGQVVAGVRFTGAGRMQVSGAGYFGATSKSLGASRPDRQNTVESRTLAVTFLQPTTAFGLDAMEFAGFSRGGTVSVFASGGALLGTFAISLPGAPATTFVGWHAAGGIGRVELVAGGIGSADWSPRIDNVTFGVAASTVPEPATVVLLLGGLVPLAVAARRRTRAG